MKESEVVQCFWLEDLEQGGEEAGVEGQPEARDGGEGVEEENTEWADRG